MKFACFVLAFLMCVKPALHAEESIPPVADQTLYLQQADIALREGRLTQAGQMIAWLESNGSRVDGDDIALLKAEYAVARRDVAAAAMALSAVKSATRNPCRLHVARGWVAANRQAYDDAIIALASAARTCPDDAGAWNLLGLVLMRKGESDAAAEAFGQARILAPDDAGILNNHALALLQKGDTELAMQQLTLARARSPENKMIASNLDFVSGMLGLAPVRRTQDSDAIFGARLVSYAQGAKAATNDLQANSLFSRAVLTMDRFDQTIWSQVERQENQR